ncbi:hypothetical protein E2C01_050334 [Portunus trituberculatus]|uniref:Uncharacterized protein n=1 Tax=Portunus trituberculatus TaxID=210409 RepID=A0A5B7GIM9_PORTR|nr:hypothetical protein [Portunus trituberculatus]
MNDSEFVGLNAARLNTTLLETGTGWISLTKHLSANEGTALAADERGPLILGAGDGQNITGLLKMAKFLRSDRQRLEIREMKWVEALHPGGRGTSLHSTY